jgi:hypothetical protein
MTEVTLNCAGIHAIVSQLVAARMAQFLSIRPHLQIDPFDSTDPKPWRMFLLKGMKCIRKLFSAAVISSWIF